MPTPQELERAWTASQAVQDQLRASPGWPLMAALQGLARSYRLFVGNHRELDGFLKLVDSPQGLPIWDVEHSQRLDDALDELDRLLHNFLASAYSCVRHTIVFREQRVPDGSPLADEYARRNPAAGSPMVTFVHQLRNETQHVRLPVASGHMHFWRNDENEFVGEHGFVLSLQALRSWEWEGKAKQYVDGLTEDPKVGALTSEYAGLIGGFADWFVRAFATENIDALDEFLRLNDQLRHASAPLRDPRLWKGGRDPQPG